MEKSKIVNIQQYKIGSTRYNIGLVMGALRASLEIGTVEIGAVYSLLPDTLQETLSKEFMCAGGMK